MYCASVLTVGRTNNILYENTLGCLEPFQNFIWFLTVPSTDKILTTLQAKLFQRPPDIISRFRVNLARVSTATDIVSPKLPTGLVT